MIQATRSLLIAACAFLGAGAAAADNGNRYAPFKGQYRIYSGELGEQLAPSSKDRKISFIVTGPVAKEMFASMGPDEKDVCAAEPGDRSRSKKNVWCTYSKADGYTCYFGFDLRSGASIPGGIC